MDIICSMINRNEKTWWLMVNPKIFKTLIFQKEESVMRGLSVHFDFYKNYRQRIMSRWSMRKIKNNHMMVFVVQKRADDSELSLGWVNEIYKHYKKIGNQWWTNTDRNNIDGKGGFTLTKMLIIKETNNSNGRKLVQPKNTNTLEHTSYV